MSKDILSRREASGVLKGLVRPGALGGFDIAKKHLSGTDLEQVRRLERKIKSGYGAQVGASKLKADIATLKKVDQVLRQKGLRGVIGREEAKYNPTTILKQQVRSLGQKETTASAALAELKQREGEQSRGAAMAQELAQQRDREELMRKRNIAYRRSETIKEEGRLAAQSMESQVSVSERK